MRVEPTCMDYFKGGVLNVTVEFKASQLETEMITTDREQLRELIRNKNA